MWRHNWVLPSPSIVQHLIYTRSHLPFYCQVTHSLENYYSVLALVPIILNHHQTVSPHCLPSFSKSLVNMLIITGLQNSTGNLPILQGLIIYSASFQFLKWFLLMLQLYSFFKSCHERPCQKLFGNPNILYLLPTCCNAIRRHKLSNLQFPTKEEKSVSDNRSCFNPAIHWLHLCLNLDNRKVYCLKSSMPDWAVTSVH